MTERVLSAGSKYIGGGSVSGPVGDKIDWQCQLLVCVLVVFFCVCAGGTGNVKWTSNHNKFRSNNNESRSNLFSFYPVEKFHDPIRTWSCSIKSFAARSNSFGLRSNPSRSKSSTLQSDLFFLDQIVWRSDQIVWRFDRNVWHFALPITFKPGSQHISHPSGHFHQEVWLSSWKPHCFLAALVVSSWSRGTPLRLKLTIAIERGTPLYLWLLTIAEVRPHLFQEHLKFQSRHSCLSAVITASCSNWKTL